MIRGHRIFRDFTWPESLDSFERFNLIYGWNGAGKTTLTALFQCLEKGVNVSDGDVRFEIEGKTLLQGTQISAGTCPPVRVFNCDFVRASVQATESEFGPIYYLGEVNVEKQSKATDLQVALAATNQEIDAATKKRESAERNRDKLCTDRARTIKSLLLGSQATKYNNYNKGHFRHTIEQIEQGAVQPLTLSDEEQGSLRKQKDAKPKEPISAPTLTAPHSEKLLDRGKELLARSIVSDALGELTENPPLASWVQRGLDLHSEQNSTETCRFCGGVLSRERREALLGHFNDAFARFQSDMDALLSALTEHERSVSSLQLPDESRLFEHQTLDWQMAVSVLESRIGKTRAFLGALRAALEARKSNPFADSKDLPDLLPSEPPPSLSSALESVKAVIDRHNQTCGNFRSAVEAACEKLEVHHATAALDEYRAIAAEIDDATSALTKLTPRPRAIREEIETLERDIKGHRRPAEELNRELHAYLGRAELSFEVREAGYSLTRYGQIASHLSEGERTAIAFLYFLKSLQDKNFNLKKGIVVIDDPVSSLDANALFSAFSYMKKRTADCGQLFVLTHNFAFFRQVRRWFFGLSGRKSPKKSKHPARFFQVRASTSRDGQRASTLGSLDPMLKKFDSEYHYLFQRVHRAVNTSVGEDDLEQYYSLPNMARRLVEGFLAFRYPGYTTENLMVALDRAPFDAEKKIRITNLLNAHSHLAGVVDPEHDPTALGEILPVLTDVLDLIRTLDAGHYDALVELVAPSVVSGAPVEVSAT